MGGERGLVMSKHKGGNAYAPLGVEATSRHSQAYRDGAIPFSLAPKPASGHNPASPDPRDTERPMEYKADIGLEVHVHLKTNTKLFCGCPNRFGDEPNTLVCPVCLGMPGVLPVINGRALELAVRAALALECEIPQDTKFDRKSYYYPDLPKNYQISQYDMPLSKGGRMAVDLDGRKLEIRITRAHLEEDAGRLVHGEGPKAPSSVDLNRTGVPLLEIVTEPDMHTPEEAGAYLRALKQLLEYTGVSDALMQEGSMRCEPNVSVRPVDSDTLGVKTEVKNLNSIRAVEGSLAYEIKRQIKLIESGGTVLQETMLWDDAKGVTRTMRSKEEAQDYRYFPEPDLPPMVMEEDWVAGIRDSLPELPAARKGRFVSEYGLSVYDAEVLTSEKKIADYFEETVRQGVDAKKACNWITQDALKFCGERMLELMPVGTAMSATSTLVNAEDVGKTKIYGVVSDGDDVRQISPASMASIIISAEDGTTTTTVLRSTVFPKMVETGASPRDIIESEGLKQVSDSSAVEDAAKAAIEANPKALADYRGGNKSASKFLFGQVMRQMKGKANPKVVGEVLERVLEEMA